MRHPLINKRATHYDTKEKPTIYRREHELTVREMIGACKFNMGKYSDREKGQDELDAEKLADYMRYKDFLCDMIAKDKAVEHITVENAYAYLGIELSYKVQA